MQMLPRLLRTTVGFAGGFAAIWLVFNLQPRGLGVVAGVVVFLASIVASNIVYNLLVSRQQTAAQSPGRRQDDNSGKPPP